MREHDTLGAPGRTRRVHLQDRPVPVRHGLYVAGRTSISPGGIRIGGALAHQAGDVRCCGMRYRRKLAFDQHLPGLRALDDFTYLRHRKSPVDRHGDCADLYGTEEEFEERERVLAEIGDAVTGPDPIRDQAAGDLPCAILELGVRQRDRGRGSVSPCSLPWQSAVSTWVLRRFGPQAEVRARLRDDELILAEGLLSAQVTCAWQSLRCRTSESALASHSCLPSTRLPIREAAGYWRGMKCVT